MCDKSVGWLFDIISSLLLCAVVCPNKRAHLNSQSLRVIFLFSSRSVRTPSPDRYHHQLLLSIHRPLPSGLSNDITGGSIGDLFVNGGRMTPSYFPTTVDIDQMHSPDLMLNAVDEDGRVGVGHFKHLK